MQGEIDHIGAIAELESCSYILFIYTSKICHHPYLRPPVQATASNIECQPVVTQSQYDHYVSQQEDLEKRQKEKELEKAEGQTEGEGYLKLMNILPNMLLK